MKTPKHEDNKDKTIESKSIEFNNYAAEKDGKKVQEQPQIFWTTYYHALELASFHSFCMERRLW